MIEKILMFWYMDTVTCILFQFFSIKNKEKLYPDIFLKIHVNLEEMSLIVDGDFLI